MRQAAMHTMLNYIQLTVFTQEDHFADQAIHFCVKRYKRKNHAILVNVPL